MNKIADVNFGMPKAGGPGQLSPIPLIPRPGFGALPDPDSNDPHQIRPRLELHSQICVRGKELSPLGTDGEMTGDITAERAVDLKIRCDAPTVNGVYVDGDANYRIENADVSMTGYCLNDFIGNGAALQVMGQTEVEVENSAFTTAGVLRSCIFAGEHAKLVVKDCQLVCEGGEVGPDYPGVFEPAMVEAPPSMEVAGHSRLCLLAGNAHAYFHNCKIVSDAWAALSTDASWGDTYLEANHCDITVKRPGYATFSDEGSIVVFNDCKVKTASHAGMICGNAKIQFNRCHIDSDRFGVYVFAIMSGNGSQLAQVTVNDCDVHVKEIPFRIRGNNAYIDVRNSRIVSDQGILLHAAVFDDPMATQIIPGEPLYGVKAAFTDMDMAGDIIHEDENRAMALSYSHTKHRGAIRNASLQMDASSRWFATGDSEIAMVGAFAAEQIDAPEGVTIKMAWAEQPEHRELTLASGGKLIINEDLLQ